MDVRGMTVKEASLKLAQLRVGVQKGLIAKEALGIPESLSNMGGQISSYLKNPENSPLVGALAGAGLGGLAGGATGYFGEDDPETAKRRGLTRALTGAISGGALGLGGGLINKQLSKMPQMQSELNKRVEIPTTSEGILNDPTLQKLQEGVLSGAISRDEALKNPAVQGLLKSVSQTGEPVPSWLNTAGTFADPIVTHAIGGGLTEGAIRLGGKARGGITDFLLNRKSPRLKAWGANRAYTDWLHGYDALLGNVKDEAVSGLNAADKVLLDEMAKYRQVLDKGFTAKQYSPEALAKHIRGKVENPAGTRVAYNAANMQRIYEHGVEHRPFYKNTVPGKSPLLSGAKTVGRFGLPLAGALALPYLLNAAGGNHQTAGDAYNAIQRTYASDAAAQEQQRKMLEMSKSFLEPGGAQ